MSTSVNLNAKPNMSIDIPYGFIGLVFYYDKYLFTLPEGKYKLDESVFTKLIQKHHFKKDEKNPRYNFNLHYISLSKFDIVLEFNKRFPTVNKTHYKITSNFQIGNPLTFAKNLLITWYKTTNKRTEAYINSWFKDFFEIITFKRHRTKSSVDIYKMAIAYFKKLGIQINALSITFNDSTGEQPILDSTTLYNNTYENNSNVDINDIKIVSSDIDTKEIN